MPQCVAADRKAGHRERTSAYSPEDIDRLEQRKSRYKSWLLKNIFDAYASESAGAVVVFAVDSGKPVYRDDVPG